ncbi:GRIP and coiled-coil domain-containing protein 2-like [Venturia canescens]|uniref:GRIP and coiled-coil domain-containing protein 2-like n=1 Tax=Venturia canescens TaxID=32260 RepID=UPI001C9CA3A5|nr:GRIP and coiled-coil domain-containing protein 2-like [Venturia canescens]
MSSEVGENDMDKIPERQTNGLDANVNSETKDDFEERYNRLKGFAIKLKKKGNDLEEKLINLENEKQKILAEKEQLQNKILQISDNAKSLQLIQSEYDKVQDHLEKQRAENKKISKNLETVVLENASLKESLYEERESHALCKKELERRIKAITNLENSLKNEQKNSKKVIEEKKAESLIKEQREKDYEEMKNKLQEEIQSHEATKAMLEAAKQERTTNSVLSLEVDNYERSVEDLKSKLEEETSKREILERRIEESVQGITELENEVQSLRDNCLMKSNEITVLSDKNEGLKGELCEKRDEIARLTNEIQALVESVESAKQENIQLTVELEKLKSDKRRGDEEIKSTSKKSEEQRQMLEAEVARLESLVSSVNEELDALRNEYNGYKLRAQSVLRTKQGQGKESGTTGRNVAEIQEELEHTKNHASQLQLKLESYSENVKSLSKELNITKEERDRSLQDSRESAEKIANLAQDYNALRDQYRKQTSTMEKERSELLTKIDTLVKHHESEKNELETKYRKEISRLESEVEKITGNTIGQVEYPQSTNAPNERHHDLKSEHDSQSRSTELFLQEREDGEGSESVESYPTGMRTNEELPRRHSLVPLDELLNSSDDYLPKTRKESVVTISLPRKVDRQELEVCERRVKHLTILLADTERDVAKLTQLNQLLKEDIRRQQRSVEREHIANNFEYMKNVILKFITLKNGDERTRLIPVLNTILKLSPEETHQLNQIAGVGRGWLPAIPIPGWHNG